MQHIRAYMLAPKPRSRWSSSKLTKAQQFVKRTS